MKPRLKEQFEKKIKQELLKDGGFSNAMQVPTFKKIVVNSGVGDAVSNPEAIDDVVEILTLITGQKPVVRKAKKAISGFKIREGLPIGVSVTLRGDRMWEFFDKLVNIVLPRTKDFHGVPSKGFDGAGNFSLGIPEHGIFPEVDPNKVQKIRSLQVTIVTSTTDNNAAKMLLDKFGFPFSK